MTQDDRNWYVVELAISGVAVVHVEAVSDEDAREKAIACVRPVDVTELDEVSVRRGVLIDGESTRALADHRLGGPQAAATGPE